MKNKHEEIKKFNKLSPQMVERLHGMEANLNKLKTESHINEQAIKELDNLISELLVLRSSFVDNVINWTKQGYLLEE